MSDAATLDQTDVQSRLDALQVKYREIRAAYTGACRERNDARRRAEKLQQEVAQLRALVGDESELDEPASLVFLLGKYPEIRRAYELVESLYSAPDGQYAAVANRMLSMIASICEAVEPKAGKGKAA